MHAADADAGAATARHGHPRWQALRAALAGLPLLVPLLVLALGLLATAGVGNGVARSEALRAQAAFDRAVAGAESEVRRRFDTPLYGLRGIAGSFEAAAVLGMDLSRAQFQAQVMARDLALDFPGIRGFGVIEQVDKSQDARFEARQRADGAPEFKIHQFAGTEHPDRFVIRQIEPLANNRAALGLDLGSEAQRRAAIQRAIDTASPTLTEPIALVQDGQHTAGFLICLPLYRTAAALKAPELRRSQLRSVVYAPVVAHELLAGVGDAVQGQIALELYAGSQAGPASQRVFSALPPAAAASAGAGHRPAFESRHALVLVGQLFTLRVVSTPAFEATLDHSQAAFTVAAGLLLSAFLAWLAHLTTAGRARAERLAAGMTADLSRLAMVARRISNAVVITGLDRRITWVNPGFERLTGYALDEVRGQSPGALLGSPEVDRPTQERLRAALASGQPFHGELCNRNKQGERYWIEIEIQPIHDAQGAAVGFLAVETDITAKKEADAALRASQALLDRTGRIGGAGGWRADLPTQRMRWTDQTCRLHGVAPGFQPTVEEALGFFAPDARQQIRDAADRAIRTGEGFDLALPLCNTHGDTVWVRLVGELETAAGRPVALVGAMQDITARRALEAELRARHALVEGILKHLPCGLSVFDDQLRLVMANQQFTELLALPPALVDRTGVGFEDLARFNAERGPQPHSPTDLDDPDQGRLPGAVGALRQADGTPRFELLRPAGTALELRGAPIPGGGYVTTYTDITERQRAEREIERRGALLRVAIEAVDEAFVLYDRDDRLVLCNDKYRQTYAGIAHLLVPGSRFEDIVRAGALRGDYPQAVGRVEAWVAERVAAHLRADTTLIQPLADGRTLRIIERKLPDGHIVGFRIDVTELARAVEAAHAASEAKSQFLANVSHELRTPMNAILGMLALLRKAGLSPRQADYAVKAEGAARSLLGLLNDVLDFSKADAGKMTLDPHPFSLSAQLDELAVILSANTTDDHVALLFDIDPALPDQVVGDALRLQQVLINLAGNALKFTREGEVVVALHQLARADGLVRIGVAVRDTGIGIPAESQARIFDGFTQAEASTTRRFGGTGLGLAISRHLVGLMGGSLALDSTPGVGTRFHFEVTLPEVAGDEGRADGGTDGGADGGADDRADAAAGGLRPGASPNALANANANAAPAQVPTPQPVGPLLLLDAQPTSRALTARSACALGWTVHEADSEAAALALLADDARTGQPWAGLLVSWPWTSTVPPAVMPVVDWGLLHRLHTAAQAQGGPPLLLIASVHGREALAQRPTVEQALVAGCVLKPVTTTALAAALADTRDPAARAARSPGAPAAGQGASAGATPTAVQRLAGLRLLLAEDNPNNQQVARELLEDEGATVQIAHHGQEAVDAVARAATPFDLVLMDLQMPVLDGLAAAGVIRRTLGEEGLPIVAMTANAMASDRAACLAAGMNDHVGKPFDMAQLVRVINHWTGRDTATGRQRPTPATELPAPVDAAARAAGVALSAAVARMGGRLDIYQRMLRHFVQDLSVLPQALQAHAAQHDVAELARQLHTLKGVAATLGANGVASQAAALERQLAGEAGVPVAAPEQQAVADAAGALAQASAHGLLPLMAALSATLAGEASAGASGATAPAGGAERQALAQALGRLAGLLRDSDMGAVDLATAITRDFDGLLDARWPALEDAVLALDFDTAAQQCDALRHDVLA